MGWRRPPAACPPSAAVVALESPRLNASAVVPVAIARPGLPLSATLATDPKISALSYPPPAAGELSDRRLCEDWGVGVDAVRAAWRVQATDAACVGLEQRWAGSVACAGCGVELGASCSHLSRDFHATGVSSGQNHRLMAHSFGTASCVTRRPAPRSTDGAGSQRVAGIHHACLNASHTDVRVSSRWRWRGTLALEGHVGRLVFGLDMLDNFKSLDPKGVAGSEGRERGGGLSEAIPPARDVQCAPGTREERTCRGL